MRARVLVRPKAGILDPQGVAVERALPALGFEGVANVHVGRLIELDVDDPSQLEAIRWNKQPPVPSLPDDVVARTREKYLDAYRRLTGRELA